MAMIAGLDKCIDKLKTWVCPDTGGICVVYRYTVSYIIS